MHVCVSQGCGDLLSKEMQKYIAIGLLMLAVDPALKVDLAL